MKRLHVHISVDDIDASRRFYTALLGQAPSVDRPDYAKWAVDDPRVNLAISAKPDRAPGLNHLGVQAETEAELSDLHARLAAADLSSIEEAGAQCCYARSDKHWTADPQGVVWEMFRTMDEIETYGANRAPGVDATVPPAAEPQGCCGT